MKSNLTSEQKAELTKLLVSGIKPTKAAQQLGITSSTAGSYRARLLRAGAVDRMRSKRSTKKLAPKPQQVVETVTNPSKVTPYRFVVGGTQITVNKAKELNFFSDRVEINF
jgi:transposase